MMAVKATLRKTGRTRSQARLSWIFCMVRSSAPASGQRPVIGVEPGPARRKAQMHRTRRDLIVLADLGHDHLVAEARGDDLVIAEILHPLDGAGHRVRRSGSRELDEFRADAEGELAACLGSKLRRGRIERD